MKKNKIISVILIMSILLMGVGYAAWTDTLTINGTVSTGNLEVEFQEECGYPRYFSWDNKWFEPDYFTVDLSHDAKNPMITVNDMYPGCAFWYEMKAENVGSIPVIVESVTVDLTNTAQVFDDTMKVYGWVVHMRPGQYRAVNFLWIRGIELSNLQTWLNSRMQGWELQNGDYLAFDDPGDDPDTRQVILEAMPELGELDPDENNCLYFYMPLSASDDTENLTAQQFDINVNFKQFNQ